MADDSIVINIELDEQGNIKTFKKIESNAKKSGERAGKNFESEFSDSIKGIAKVASVVAGAIATIGTALTFREAISAAQAQENAINRLNTQLRLTGDFSQQVTEDFQNFASELQNVSTVGDEVTLSNIALAKSFGATNEQAKLVASAAADLSASFGIDLESATRNVAKTLGGYAGELGEVIPALKELSQEQLQAGAGVDLLAQRFAGAAAGELNTFTGVLTSFNNVFGDLLEEIGFFVTRSPFVIEAFKVIRDAISGLIEETKQARGEFDIFSSLVKPALLFSNTLITTVVPVIELVANAFKVSLNGIIALVDTVVLKISSLADPIIELGDKIGLQSDLFKNIKNFRIGAEKNFSQSANAAKESFQSILDFPLSQGLAEKNEQILEKLTVFNERVQEQSAIASEALNNRVQDSADKTSALATSLLDFFNGVNISIDKTAATAKKTAQQIGQQFEQALVRSISGGIQTIVNAVAAGENAFEAFGKFVLKTIGNLAIQLGETLIAAGIGIESVTALGGVKAIAAGAALVAIGSVIKSFVGGGGGASGGGGAGGGGGGPVGVGGTTGFEGVENGTATTEPDDLEERNPQTGVTVNIQGDVLGDDTAGEKIVDLVNSAFEERGATLVQRSV